MVRRLVQVTQEMAHLLGEEAWLQGHGPGQFLAPEFVADTKLVQRISPAASPAVSPTVSPAVSPAVFPAVFPAVSPAGPAVSASKQLELLHTALALAARLTEHNRQLAAAALSLAAGEQRAGARSSAEAGLVTRLAAHAATLATRVAEAKTRLLAPLLREARRLMTAASSAARRYQLEADVAQLGRGVAAVTSQLVRAQGGLARKVARELGHVTARLRPVARKVGSPHQLPYRAANNPSVFTITPTRAFSCLKASTIIIISLLTVG